MALQAYAAFTLGGVELSGETTANSVGDVDVSHGHVEILELNFGAERQGSNKKRAERHRLIPLRLVKRTDQTTPLLYRGLSQGQILEGEIKLFDANPDSGEIRHRFSVSLGQAQIVSMTTTSPDVYDPEDANRPVYDFLEIVAGSIVYADRVHGVEFEDNQPPALRKKMAKLKTGKDKKKEKKAV